MSRRIFSVLALACVFVAPQTFAADEPATGRIVTMSPYEVSANSVAFEHWAKYSSPHFIVYSDASTEDAMRALREFEMLHLAAVKFFDRPVYKRAPTVIVLPTERSDWRKLESTAAVEWHVAVSNPTKRLQALVLVGYDWQGWLNGGDNILLSALGNGELGEMRIEGPLWFNKGVGMFFETTQFDDDAVKIGKLSTSARVLWMRGWLPWANLFKATGSSPEFTKKDNIRSFTGQCAAFVHFMLTNRDPVWRERLMSWTAMTQAGREPTEEAFKEVFGQDWTAWQETMRKHTRDRGDKTATIRLSAEEMNFPRTRTDITPREMRELFVIAQVINQRKPASEAALDSMLEKGLKSESLRELLLEACLRWKRADAIKEQVETLIAAGTENPGVYVLKAESVFRARIPKVTLDVELDDTTAARVRALAQKALELSPGHPDATTQLAWTEALGSKVTPENIAALEKLVRERTGRAPMHDVITALAIAYLRSGNTAGARTAAESLIKSPYVPRGPKELASSLLRDLGTAP